MINMKIKRLGWVLALIGITAMMVYSQDTASDYVAPSEAVPRGKARKMQVQLLSTEEPTKQYAVIFYQGDEAFSGLAEFAEKYHVSGGHFTAIGAVNGATLGWFDPQRKMYKKIPHYRSARSDRNEWRYRALSRKTRSPHSHGGGESRRNNACRPCSRGVRITNAGSNGHRRSGNDAEAF
jgi:hypothetical protein